MDVGDLPVITRRLMAGLFGKTVLTCPLKPHCAITACRSGRPLRQVTWFKMPSPRESDVNQSAWDTPRPDSLPRGVSASFTKCLSFGVDGESDLKTIEKVRQGAPLR